MKRNADHTLRLPSTTVHAGASIHEVAVSPSENPWQRGVNLYCIFYISTPYQSTTQPPAYPNYKKPLANIRFFSPFTPAPSGFVTLSFHMADVPLCQRRLLKANSYQMDIGLYAGSNRSGFWRGGKFQRCDRNILKRRVRSGDKQLGIRQRPPLGHFPETDHESPWRQWIVLF